MACKCYHAERNFLGKIGVCWGTKECEACSCDGDESKCDFYEDKRKKAAPPPTRADRIRAMTDEELAAWIGNVVNEQINEVVAGGEAKSINDWLRWLRQEATP